jgi:rhamnosyl/mannosyltransferase
MRILQLGKYWHPQRGGMETLLQQYAEGLVARGHQVRAIVAAGGAEEARSIERGVDLWRAARHGEVAAVPVCPSLPSLLRRSLVDFDPDVVHLHLPNPLAVLAWLVVGDDRPLVISYHSDIVRQQALLKLWAPWRDRVLSRARWIHTTSQALIESSEVLRRHRARCRAIAPGIDPSPWRAPDPEAVARWRSRIGDGAFLFVGRLVYYKGLDVLLEAARSSDLRVAICGDGPLRPGLESAAAPMADRVAFLGDVEAEDLPALHAASAGFVLPSVAASETFGVVQLEAMAARRPLVVSRASEGVASVHAGAQSALLVPPGDAVALRDAMLRVRDDAVLRAKLVEAADALLVERYVFDDRLADLERLLEAAAGRSTAA